MAKDQNSSVAWGEELEGRLKGKPELAAVLGVKKQVVSVLQGELVFPVTSGGH